MTAWSGAWRTIGSDDRLADDEAPARCRRAGRAALHRTPRLVAKHGHHWLHTGGSQHLLAVDEGERQRLPCRVDLHLEEGAVERWATTIAPAERPPLPTG